MTGLLSNVSSLEDEKQSGEMQQEGDSWTGDEDEPVNTMNTWWIWVLAAAGCGFIWFIIWKRRKDDEEEWYLIVCLNKHMNNYEYVSNLEFEAYVVELMYKYVNWANQIHEPINDLVLSFQATNQIL